MLCCIFDALIAYIVYVFFCDAAFPCVCLVCAFLNKNSFFVFFVCMCLCVVCAVVYFRRVCVSLVCLPFAIILFVLGVIAAVFVCACLFVCACWCAF